MKRTKWLRLSEIASSRYKTGSRGATSGPCIHVDTTWHAKSERTGLKSDWNSTLCVAHSCYHVYSLPVYPDYRHVQHSGDDREEADNGRQQLCISVSTKRDWKHFINWWDWTQPEPQCPSKSFKNFQLALAVMSHWSPTGSVWLASMLYCPSGSGFPSRAIHRM